MTLYIKNSKGKYQEWGEIESYDQSNDVMRLPHGIWFVEPNHVRHIAHLSDKNEIGSMPIRILNRVILSEIICNVMSKMSRGERGASFLEMADEIAKVLIPIKRRRKKTGNTNINFRRTGL